MEREREYSIRDLIKRLARRWYVIVIAALIFGLALNVFDYVKTKKKQASSDEKTIAAMEANLGEDAVKKVRSRVTVQERSRNLVRELERELSDSILLDLDWEHLPTVTAVYLVETEDSDRASAQDILHELQILMSSDETGEKVRRALPDTYGDRNVKRFLELLVPTVTVEQNVLNIEIFAATEQDAKTVSGVVREVLSDAEKALSDVFGTFSVKTVSEHFTYQANSMIRDRRAAKRVEITALENDLAKLTDGLTNDEKAYFNALQQTPSGKVSILRPKFLLAGLLGGAVLAVIVLISFYFLSNRIYTAEDVTNHLGMRLLGTVPSEAPLKNGKKETRTRAEEVFLSVERLLSANELEDRSLLVVDLANTDRGKAVLKEFGERLSEKKVKMTVIDRISGDPEKAEEWKKASGAVLFGAFGKTKVRSIRTMRSECRELGLPVAGCLMTEEA